MTINELLRRACYYAEQDRRSYLDCVEHMNDPESERIKRDTQEFIDALHAYRIGRWGKPKAMRWTPVFPAPS